MKNWLKENRIPLLAFFIPILIMGIIYAFNSIYPFGDETLLTIDLGQQYVDFYRGFQDVIIENPGRIFYALNKSLGGEMAGIWSYYLMSPLNIIFLFFPPYHIDIAVTLISLLKIGLIGLSMSYFLEKAFRSFSYLTLIFSTSYALMGYMIIYQMNLMWLDGVALLPLVALGVEEIQRKHRGTFYTVALGLAFFTNYYIGYMIALFITLYFIYRLISARENRYHERLNLSSKRYMWKTSGLFIWHSLLAAGIGLILYLPTLYSLLQSKAAYGGDAFDWSFAYPVQDILSKFVVGAFNFDQLPSGLPNIFVGSLVLIFFVTFFFNNNFSKRERLGTGLLTLFLVFSMNIESLNRFWHGFQDPIWFPYRFSFVFSFFLIFIAFRSSQHFSGLPKKMTVLSFAVAASILLLIFEQDFDYIEPIQLLVTFLFIGLFLLSLNENIYGKKKWINLLLILLVFGELGVNGMISFNRISHVDRDTFVTDQKALDEVIQPIQVQDKSWYRLEKTFHRSKNDSHQADYMGATHFSSTHESRIPDLYQALGLPASNGYSVYSNGTLLTDALFGIKYYLADLKSNNLQYTIVPHPDFENQYTTRSELIEKGKIEPILDEELYEYDPNVVQTKPDLQYYPKVDEIEETFELHVNPYYFSLGFLVSSGMQDVSIEDDNPMEVQNKIFEQLSSSQQSAEPLIEKIPSQITTENVTLTTEDGERKAVREQPGEPSFIEISFSNDFQDAYYLTMNQDISGEDVNLYLNGKPFYFYDTYDDTVVHNLAGRSARYETVFRIELVTEEIPIDDIEVYQFDYHQFAPIAAEVQEKGLEITSFTDTTINGEISVAEKDSVMMFTLPYDTAWKIHVDGQPVETFEVLDSLLAIELPEGEHHIELQYRNPWFLWGAFSSLVFLLLTYITWLWQRKSE